MAELFHMSGSNIVEHIGHIYEEGELDEGSTCRKFRQVRVKGDRQVTRELPFYHLDMIISLGYRVKSLIATQFLTTNNKLSRACGFTVFAAYFLYCFFISSISSRKRAASSNSSASAWAIISFSNALISFLR